VSDNPMFLYAAEYESVDDAKADLEALKKLHREHIVGTYDAAVLTKNEEGKVKIVDKTEKPTQHGGWAGLAAGAAIGVIFPPSIDLSSVYPGQRAGRCWCGRAHRPPQGQDVQLGPKGGRGDARRERGGLDSGRGGDDRAGGRRGDQARQEGDEEGCQGGRQGDGEGY
jgi:hypothetical protein